MKVTKKEAHRCFRRALELNPGDPETLGMWGGLYKRQKRFPEAADCYARGSALSPESLYMRVNEAAVTLLCSPAAAGTAVGIYRKLLDDIRRDDSLASDHWAQLVAGEAAFAIGDIDLARAYFRIALQSNTPAAVRSAIEQLRLIGDAGFQARDANGLADWLETEISAVGHVSMPSPAVDKSTDPDVSRSSIYRTFILVRG